MAVLEKNGCEVVVPAQRCCGMPYLENGELESARECRRDNVTSLLPFVRAGYTIVSPGPTCRLMLRKEYPVLGPEEEAREVAARTLDLCEYLMRRHAAGGLAMDFQRSPGKIVYHVPCHLKVQDIGFKSRDLLQLITGSQVVTVEKCTGHDGTWSMKTEYFPLSMKVGRPVFDVVERRAARPRRDGLPARRDPDPPGNREDAEASDPDRRRGVRIEEGRVESCRKVEMSKDGIRLRRFDHFDTSTVS